MVAPAIGVRVWLLTSVPDTWYDPVSGGAAGAGGAVGWSAQAARPASQIAVTPSPAPRPTAALCAIQGV
jgi:hypothetical protein